MSKSILVIDIPSVCIDCPCHFAYDTGKVECGVNKKELLSDNIETYKPKWCPLKEVPQLRQVNPDPYCANKSDAYDSGYNACIREILEERD